MLKKILVYLFVLLVLNSECTIASSFLYDVKEIENKNAIHTNADVSFNFESEAQILIEPLTGEVIYANNEEEELLPASVTKVMTLLLIMEQIDSGNLDYSDVVTCSKNASEMGGSQIWFKENEILTIEEALKAICVVSANDVTVAMAELIGGSEDNFVIMMNGKAKELGMNHTHFVNCHGIDEEGHYTCAKDIAIMARELVNKHPNILKYTSIWMDTLRNGEFGLNSTNKLIRYYDGATGLKTGYTKDAGYNLVATATRGDNTFLSVILKAPTSEVRTNETKQLLDYAFSNYMVEKLCSTEAIIDEIPVDKNIEETVKVKIAKPVYRLTKKSEKSDVENVLLLDNVRAPIRKGDVVGKMEFRIKDTNELIGESEIVATNEVKKSDFKKYLLYIVNKFFLHS